MNKIERILNIVCAVSWAGVIAIIFFCPVVDFRLIAIVASSLLAMYNVTDFIKGSVSCEREVEGSNS